MDFVIYLINGRLAGVTGGLLLGTTLSLFCLTTFYVSVIPRAST